MGESTKPSSMFPGRLRAAREYRDLSQGGLADRTQLKPSAISHFETGARKPSFDNLRRLADALDVTTDYLLGRVEEMEATQAKADRLHRHLSSLSSEYKEVAEDIIANLAKRAEAKRKKDD